MGSSIPPDLVKSLMALGLLESEAKIYVALVMMNNSEVKELIDFVGMSKPNTYESLRSLEEKGLIVAVSERPIVYQAVAPEIGLELLIDTHLRAKKEAAKLFATVDRNIREYPPDKMWFIFSEKNVDYKIRDMVRNAKREVIFLGSEKYLKFLKPLARKDLCLSLTVISEEPGLESALRKTFGTGGANVHVIKKSEAVKLLSISKTMSQEEFVPSFEKIFLQFNYDKMMILMVDDAEFLYVPPFFSDDPAAMNSKSRIMIENMKLVHSAMDSYFSRDRFAV